MFGYPRLYCDPEDAGDGVRMYRRGDGTWVVQIKKTLVDEHWYTWYTVAHALLGGPKPIVITEADWRYLHFSCPKDQEGETP